MRRQIKFRFGTKLLLVAVTLSATALGFLALERDRCRKQQIAVERLQQFGTMTVGFDPAAKSRPKWLAAILGDNSYSHAIDVRFYNTNPFIRIAGNEDLRNLTDLPSLRTLMLQFTGVDSNGLQYLRGLRSLRSLDLSLLSIDDAGLKHLSGLVKLEDLELMHTGIGDEGIAHLQALKDLKSLNLSSTKISSAAIHFLAEMRQLRSLDVSYTSVSDDAAASIASLHQLNSLDLSGTKISDAGLAKLASLKALKQLDLSNSNVTQSGVESLKAALPECEIEWYEQRKAEEGLLQRLVKPQTARLALAAVFCRS